MPEGLKIDREMSPLEYHMLKKLGLTEDEMEIVHDLARHAAEKAAESAFIVALTAPIPLINLVSVTSALLLGQSAMKVANRNAEELADIFSGRMPHEGLKTYDGSFQA